MATRKERTLDQIKEDIRLQISHKGTYSHTIVALDLKIIENRFGEAAALKAMRELQLQDHGWTIPKVTHRKGGLT